MPAQDRNLQDRRALVTGGTKASVVRSRRG